MLPRRALSLRLSQNFTTWTHTVLYNPKLQSENELELTVLWWCKDYSLNTEINKSVPVAEDMASCPCSFVLCPAWPSGIYE